MRSERCASAVMGRRLRLRVRCVSGGSGVSGGSAEPPGNVVCGDGFNYSQHLYNKSQIVRKCGNYFFIYIHLHRYRHYPLFPFFVWHPSFSGFFFFFVYFYGLIFDFLITQFLFYPLALSLYHRKLPKCSFAKCLLFFLLLFKFMAFGDNYFRHYHLY